MGTTERNMQLPAVTNIGNHREPPARVEGWVPPVYTGNHPTPTSDQFVAFLQSKPSWQRDALCQEPAYSTVNFFPEKGQSDKPAKAVCARCLVADECLAYANDNYIRHGVYGGLNPNQRRGPRTNKSGARHAA